MELRLVSVTYACKHFGSHKTKSKGLRPHQRVLPSGCPFEIRFAYDRKLSAFVISRCTTDHNHPIGASIAKHYSSNRRLAPDEAEEALTLLDVGGSTTLVRNYLEMKTGKVIMNQDIHNLKHKFSASCNSDVSKVVTLLNQFVEKDEGNVACVVLDDDEKGIELIYIQSSYQRQLFNKFPELIMVDGTYKINNVGMSLYDILIEDGYGSSRIVAYCLVTQETKVSLLNLMQIFKKYNPSWDKVKVALTDKDFSEIASIKEEFPQAVTLLCQFHMLKCIRTKIPSYCTSSDTKEKLMQLSKKLVYCWTEQEFTDTLKSIKDTSPEFYEYIEDNWINCKKSWCNYEQKDLFTMLNSTTNRIEAHHRILKLHLKNSASLSWNLEKLLVIIHHYSHVDSHNDFLEKMCVTVDTSESSSVLQPFFQYCTAYAARKIAEEYKKASAKDYQMIESDDSYKVYGTLTYEICKSVSCCTCQFFSAMHLPCRHMFFVLVQNGKDIFISDSIADRWTKRYNDCGNSTPSGDVYDISHSNELEVVKSSGCKTSKLSRHQKYRQMMIVCKELCDTSSDLPIKKYQATLKLIKDVTQMIRGGKAVVIKGLPTTQSDEEGDCNDDMLSYSEPALDDIQSDINDSSSFSGPEDDSSLNSAHVDLPQASETLPRHSDTPVTPPPSLNSFKHMKPLSLPSVEVLKTVQIVKTKQRGRPSRKRSALSFKSNGVKNSCRKKKQVKKSLPRSFVSLSNDEKINSK